MTKTKSKNNNNGKIYWIRCSDGGFLTMSADRVEKLLDLMPTLRFLLLGHPCMQPKTLKTLKDGTEVLEIPRDLGVSKKSFLLLVNCVFEIEPLPPRTTGDSRLEELVEIMTILGGCEVLEQRLQDLIANPMTPAEDTTGKFIWQMVQNSNYNFEMPVDLKRQGYSFASYTKHGITKMFFFRKEKIDG